MNKLNHFATALAMVILSVISLQAQVPAGYYSSLNGKSEGALKTAIHNLLYNHTHVSSYSDLPKYFQRTDVYPDGSSRWWDMYSDIPLYAPNFTGLNREHAFPKSWWGGSTSTPAYIDLNHLYHSERNANTAKNNFPLGVVSSASFDNGICKVGTPVAGQGGGAQKVFEPAREYRGDFARTYFYMVSTYQNLTWKYTYMVDQNLYPTLNAWSINLLMKWHREDPVSQKEIDRNNVVYTIQNNRNPFIDYPELAEYLWGNKKGQIFNESSVSVPGGEPNLITPLQNMELDFGQVAIGKSATMRLQFRGENLTGALSLLLSKPDRAMFSIPTRTISTSLVNTENGYWLEVTYKPTSTGTHEARLIVSDGGIPGSRGIGLKGECLPMPELSAFKALPATDITENSYTANWEIPEGDVVDYYVVTRTRISDGNSSVEELVAENNSLEITDFAASTSETYYVQSCRLGERSPRSNEIIVDHSGVTGVDAGLSLGTVFMEGGVRFVCGKAHHNARFYDISGQLVMTLPTVENDTEVLLPYGVYLIITDEQRVPLKVMVK